VESDSVRRANEQPLTTSANTGWNTQTEMNP
jgi:hypothetical protein